MIYKLTGAEIIGLIAKHASKDYPDLAKFDGKSGSVSLQAYRGEFWAEIEVKEDNNG